MGRLLDFCGQDIAAQGRAIKAQAEGIYARFARALYNSDSKDEMIRSRRFLSSTLLDTHAAIFRTECILTAVQPSVISYGEL